MKHSIENAQLQLSVKQTGAELCSIQSKASGLEYLWQADPAYWANHAPVLFPIVGGLKDNTYHHEDKTYSLPRHGFIRYNDKVELREKGEDMLRFGLRYDEGSLQTYPFLFDFGISFRLEANQIIISHVVKNLGDTDMYFSLGAHPAFACPLHEGEVYSDYFLEFEQQESVRTWVLDEGGQLAEEGALMMDETHVLPLHEHLFDHDALIFKELKSRQVRLKSRKSSQQLVVHYEGWPYLGIWAKPQAAFVCIEPWLGLADHVGTDQQLKHKIGILKLASKEQFEAAYRIEILE